MSQHINLKKKKKTIRGVSITKLLDPPSLMLKLKACQKDINLLMKYRERGGGQKHIWQLIHLHISQFYIHHLTKCSFLISRIESLHEKTEQFSYLLWFYYNVCIIDLNMRFLCNIYLQNKLEVSVNFTRMFSLSILVSRGVM